MNVFERFRGLQAGWWFAGVLLLGSFSAYGSQAAIRIASIHSHQGFAAQSDAAAIEGAHLAIAEVNDRGGILGRQLELLDFDTGSTPIGAKVAADRAAQSRVTAIVGPAWSAQALVAAKVAQKNGIPMIADMATHEGVTRVGDYIFRACFTDPFQGRVMAHFVRNDLKALSAVVFTDLTSDYSLGLARQFQTNFERLGGKVLQQIGYKPQKSNFSKLVSGVKGLDPDVLFVPGHDESALILKAAAGIGLRAIPVGGDGWSVGNFAKWGGERVKLGYHCTHWTEAVDTPASRAFVARYPASPAIQVPRVLAYDAVMLLVDAIRRAGSGDAQRVRDALSKTENFEGVTGNITFDRHGDPIKPAVIMRNTEGRIQFLKTIYP